MNSLHEQLNDIQNLIKENERLREKYPEHKTGLLISLTTLQQLEFEIIKKILDSDILCELENQGIMEYIEERWKDGDANSFKM